MGKPFVDRVGERYGRLTIVEYKGVSEKAGKYRLWRCVCDCGNECVVSFRELSRGHTKSCGCWFREVLRASAGKNALPTGKSAFNQLFGAYRKSARGRGYGFALTVEEFRDLTSQDCAYCGAPPTTKFRAQAGTNGDYLGNGIDRIDNTLGYVASNVRPCCKQCNIAKGILTETEFREWIARVCTHLTL